VDPEFVEGESWASELLVALNSIAIDRDNTLLGSIAVLDASPGPYVADCELLLDKNTAVTGDVAADSLRLGVGTSVSAT
jgi:hypothetical protein